MPLHRLSKRLLAMELDTALAALGLIVALAMTGLSLLVLGRVVYALFGVLLAITCVGWLVVKRLPSKREWAPSPNGPIALVLAAGFFLLLTLSVLLFYQRPDQYSRPMAIFVILAAMAGVVAVQVVFLPRQPKYYALALSQVLLLGLSVQFSQILMFPDVIGVDPALHKNLVNWIVTYGHLIPGFDYSTTPLFQLEVTTGMMLFGVGYEVASPLLITVSEALLAPLSVLLIGRYLFDTRVGLMASLVLAVSPYHIYFGIWAVPNTFAVLTIPLVVYVLLKLKGSHGVRDLSISILLMIALILTHPLASLGLAIILPVIWLVRSSYKRSVAPVTKIAVSFALSMFFLVIMIGWWAYVGYQIEYIGSALVAGFRVESVTGMPEEVGEFVFTVPLIEQMLRYMGMYLFFLFSLLGCFYLLTRIRRNLDRFTFSVVGLLLFGIGFVSLAFSLTGLDARWFYLAELFLAVPLAVMVLALPSRARLRALSVGMVFLVVSSLAFFSTISPSGSIDNRDLLPNTGIRFAFTSSELTGASFFAETAVGNISSDFDYSTDLSSSVFVNYHGMDRSRLEALDGELITGNFSRDGSLKVIRAGAVDEPVRLYAIPYDLRYDPRPGLTWSAFDRVYDSGSVTAFI